MLLEEIENVIKSLNQDGEEALKNQDYEEARKIIENAESLKEFKEKVRQLQKEWEKILAGGQTKKQRKKIEHNKLKKGLRTPVDEFRIPIPEPLVELGGRGGIRNVLAKVEDKMKDKLTPYDFQGLKSNPSKIRWENTVQWCRLVMFKEGLLSHNSPRGIWEITPKGKTYLEQQIKDRKH